MRRLSPTRLQAPHGARPASRGTVSAHRRRDASSNGSRAALAKAASTAPIAATVKAVGPRAVIGLSAATAIVAAGSHGRAMAIAPPVTVRVETVRLAIGRAVIVPTAIVLVEIARSAIGRDPIVSRARHAKAFGPTTAAARIGSIAASKAAANSAAKAGRMASGARSATVASAARHGPKAVARIVRIVSGRSVAASTVSAANVHSADRAAATVLGVTGLMVTARGAIVRLATGRTKRVVSMHRVPKVSGESGVRVLRVKSSAVKAADRVPKVAGQRAASAVASGAPDVTTGRVRDARPAISRGSSTVAAKDDRRARVD